MAVARPYIGLDVDLMEKRVRKASQECLDEINLISDELQHRSTRAARRLQERVSRIREFLDHFVREA